MSFSRPALTDQELEFLNHGFVDMTYIFVNAVIATLCEPEYLKGSCDQLLIICYHHVRPTAHLRLPPTHEGHTCSSRKTVNAICPTPANSETVDRRQMIQRPAGEL